jgi:thiol-disulfide isomerase/thioredoxin
MICFSQVYPNEISPNISITHQFNEDFSLENIKGKVLVLDFWATWCAPCLASVPHLNTLQSHFSKRDDVIFLSITDENEKKVNNILRLFHFKSFVF